MKLLFHSNAPWAPTGYGQQTALFAPLLKKHFDLAISGFYGLEGALIRWGGIPVFPGMGNDYGNEVLPMHAANHFGGDPRGGLVLTLMDVWVLEPAVARKLNIVSWVPVDHDPAPPRVVEYFVASGATPLAMTHFGERMLGHLDPLYCPHAVDTSVYQPHDQVEARADAFPPGAFVVGMIAANKGRPSRKSFSQALSAFAKFAETHENAYLYLHTQMDPAVGGGENIPALIRDLKIPIDRVRIADQYRVMHMPYSHKDMARIYSAVDVLLNPSLGEGFGIPILEAQACSKPVIVTDFSAMPEVCGAGWKVPHVPYWTGLNSWQAIPDIPAIVDALEECHALTVDQREALSRDARAHALTYDIDRVFDEHMLPALAAAVARLERQTPVRIPARAKVAA